MLHLGTYPWTSLSNRQPVDPDQYTNIPYNDKIRLRAIGPVPVLGLAFSPGVGEWPKQTHLWLADHGFRQATVRLYIDGASSENPSPISADALGVAAGLVPQINNWLAEDTNISCVFFLDNEPNLERANQSPVEYLTRAKAILAALQQIFPTQTFCLAPLAQGTFNFDLWFNVLKPEYAKQKYLIVHFYHNLVQGDKAAGVKFSPEWWAAQIPNVPIIVAECGSKGDRNDVWSVFERWIKDPRILRFHWWKLSGESYPEDNFSVDMSNTAIRMAQDLWRPTRQYPVGGTSLVISPPTSSPTPATGGVTAERFPSFWNDWVRAGGPENNFRKHILGIGVLPPTSSDLHLLVDENVATANQLKTIAYKLS